MSDTMFKNLSSSEFHSDNAFCQVGSNGKGYVMGSWMMPSFSSDPSAYCVLLWFKEWTLDTAGKYIFACFGLLLMGFCHWMLTIRQETVSKYINDLKETRADNQKEKITQRNLILFRNLEVTIYYGIQ
ncbi:MAG: copper transporter family protein, partial [Flammeovirgaceae bacterium]